MLARRRVRPRRVVVVRERQVAGAEPREHPQRAERAADRRGRPRRRSSRRRARRPRSARRRRPCAPAPAGPGARGRASNSRRSARASRSRPRVAGRSDGTYTDQNWPPTPPASSRGRSVSRRAASSPTSAAPRRPRAPPGAPTAGRCGRRPAAPRAGARASGPSGPRLPSAGCYRPGRPVGAELTRRSPRCSPPCSPPRGLRPPRCSAPRLPRSPDRGSTRRPASLRRPRRFPRRPVNRRPDHVAFHPGFVVSETTFDGSEDPPSSLRRPGRSTSCRARPAPCTWSRPVRSSRSGPLGLARRTIARPGSWSRRDVIPGQVRVVRDLDVTSGR